MTDQKTDSGKHRAKRARFVPLAWAGSAVAATVLVLGVNGTLSSWTTAIITNTTDTATVSNSVILQETGPGTTPAVCTSTDSDTFANSFQCGTINKYGGTTTPLSPVTGSNTQSVTVTLKNTGSGPGNLTLKANGCTPSGGAAGAPSLCGTASPLTVKVECPAGTTTVASTTLDAFTTATATTPKSVASLAAGASIACTFTVTLSTSAPAIYGGQSVSQPLVWTLNGTG